METDHTPAPEQTAETKPAYEWPGLIHYWRQIIFLILITFGPWAVGHWARFMKLSWQFMIESF